MGIVYRERGRAFLNPIEALMTTRTWSSESKTADQAIRKGSNGQLFNSNRGGIGAAFRIWIE